MNIRAINQAGFDYTALGHIHKPQMIFHDKMAYAGALEPTDCNDTGPHGYIEGSMEDGKVTAEFVPFSCRTYQQIVLTVREDSTQFSLEEMLRVSGGAGYSQKDGLLSAKNCFSSCSLSFSIITVFF